MNGNIASLLSNRAAEPQALALVGLPIEILFTGDGDSSWLALSGPRVGGESRKSNIRSIYKSPAEGGYVFLVLSSFFVP
jgi:hypothetical protein